MNYRIQIAILLSELINHPIDKIINIIKESNKNYDADWSVNCFAFAKLFNKDGKEIAFELKSNFEKIPPDEIKFIDSIDCIGPYLNFKINKEFLARDLFARIIQNVDEYACSEYKENEKSKRLVIEYPSPNTNKPLHFGHVRNMLLGQSLSELNKFVGNTVFQVNLNNDRGVHICKSMWAYKKYGKNKTPESENIKSDYFVGKYYVKYSQEETKLKNLIKEKIESLETEKLKPSKNQDLEKIKKLKSEIEKSDYGKLQLDIKNMLLKWEENDPEVRLLWRKMNDWAEKGFKETYMTFEIEHDKNYYESNIYDKGKEIVLDGLEKGIFERLDDGAVVVRFKKKNLPKMKVLLRKEGTSLYVTQDIFLASKKMEDFNYDLSIFVIANEQDMQLRTLFAILKLLKMKGENLHYSYGMIDIPSGKMKSREGTVVDADVQVQEIKNLALKELRKRYDKLDKNELSMRSNKIAMAALRYFILKYDYTKDFVFDPEKSLSFEGETGPYLMYVYARICSIFRKSIAQQIPVPYNPNINRINTKFSFKNIDYSLFSDEHEINLIDIINKYPKTIYDSTKDLKPHVLARYLLGLSQEFNQFYHSCPILKEEEPRRKLRLALSEIVRKILKHGLNLMKIDVLNEM